MAVTGGATYPQRLSNQVDSKWFAWFDKHMQIPPDALKNQP